MKVSRLAQPEPWSPGDATDNIREIAVSDFTLSLSSHAKERMRDRGLTVGDLRHVLKHGFVYEPAQTTTRKSCFKYCIDGSTPNFEGRPIRLVVVPCVDPLWIKIVTAMWRDET